MLNTFGAGENEDMQRPENVEHHWCRQKRKLAKA
jgi:hypothetical protein